MGFTLTAGLIIGTQAVTSIPPRVQRRRRQARDGIAPPGRRRAGFLGLAIDAGAAEPDADGAAARTVVVLAREDAVIARQVRSVLR